MKPTNVAEAFSPENRKLSTKEGNMGIVLPVNDRCRIESDIYQWIVTRRNGENWQALTFWQDLGAAARDCVFLDLATPAEAAALTPFIDRLNRQFERLTTLAVSHPALMRQGFVADLGSDWSISATSHEDTARRPHWDIICNTPDAATTRKRQVMGTFRTLHFALRSALMQRFRRSDGFDSLETIGDEIAAALSGAPMPLLAALTPT